jgi:CHAT domain-containing protein
LPKAPPSVPLRRLHPGESVEQDSHSLQIFEYEIRLEKGQTFSAALRPQNTDIFVLFSDPAGWPVLGVDGTSGLPVAALFTVAETSGLYHLRVRADLPGHFSLQLHPPRSATGEDKLRAEAALAVSRGTLFLRRTDPASLHAAAQAFRSALELRRLEPYSQEIALTEYWLGRTLGKLNDHTKAREAYREAQRGFRSAGDGAAAAVVIERIAETYTNARELQAAVEVYNLALNELRRAGNHACEAEALSNLAVTEKQLGNIQAAAEAYSQALPLMRELGRRSDQITLLYNIGQLDSDLGDYQRAFQYFEQAIQIPAETPEARAAVAWALSAAGLARMNLNDLPGALQDLRSAIRLARRDGDQEALMMNLLRIGTVELKTGHTPEARGHFEEALSTAKKLANTRYQGNAAANLARVKDLEGDPAGAVKLYDQALTLNTGDIRAQALIHYGSAQAERRLGRLQEALSQIDRSIDIVESFRTKTLSDELRTSSFATLRERYELAIDLLMDLDQRQPDGGFKARAFEMSERARGRAVLEGLAETQAGIRTGVSQRLLEDEENLREKIQLKETERQLQRMNRQRPTGEARLAALDKDMAELMIRRDWVEAEIRASNPRYADLVRPQTRTLKEIQQDLLDKSSLLVSYFLGEPRSFVWLVDQTGIQSYPLPGRSKIERVARVLQTNLAAGRRREARVEVTRAARLLGTMILGPIAAQLKGQRLLIIPDGALQEIPFSILTLARPQQTPRALIENHEIVELPSSASAMSFLRRGRAGRRPPARTVALFGDPVFRSDDKRIHRSAPDPASAQEPGQTFLEPRLADLPRLISSRKEVQKIADLVPPGKRLVALDFDANLKKVLSPEMSQYRILHFATHARLDEHPELSGIVLSQVDEQGRTRDGFLHALDIYNLNLPADLVVLSACQTALGGSRGDGVGSLTRAFLYAGAKGVVVSLWSVSDQATADLMAHFYEGMLRRGLKPAAALREAQLEVRKLPGREAPYYWAGFVLQGDWE